MDKKIFLNQKRRAKEKISVKVSEGKTIKVKKTYITKFSKVDRHVPPQAPKGHSMASNVQSL